MTLQSLRERAPAMLWPALIGALFALGLVLPVLQAVRMGGVAIAMWAAAATAVGCAVAGLGGRYRLIGLGVGVGLVGLVAAFSGTLGNLGGMVGAAVHLVRGNVDPLKVYGPEVALVVCALLTWGGWAMARQSAGCYPALSLLLVAVLVVWFSGNHDVIVWFAPALVALCAMFAYSANEETPMLRVVGVSSLVVVAALALSPALQFRSDRLEQFADNLRTYITDSLFFTDPRSIYTIQADGYKPLQNRLGGPVEVEERPVMTVETSRSLLLRGTLYNEYNGLNWYDTLSSRRYHFTDPRNRLLRADALDEQRPSENLRSTSFFDTIDVTVTMNSDSASTLFVAQRAENLATPMALVPYFNMAGEIFITRDLQAGDAYSFSAPVIRGDDPLLPAILSSAAQSGEDKELSYYLRVPDAVAEQVRSLTADLVRTAATPLEKAQAIKQYLQTTFKYTTNPDYPPDNQDFVSYFVLRGKEGYCTYFASAMAIMGRLAGLPTRYVEGYIVDPSGGTALITSKQAHAWAEVYFDGFGWVAFDATPPRSMGGPRQDDTGEQQPETQPEDVPPEEQEQEAEQDPDDNEDEVPPGGGEDEQPDGEDGEPDPEDDPTPEPEEEPSPSPEPQSNPEDDPQPENIEDYQDDRPASRWWLWLLLLVAIGLLVWRGIWTRPSFVAGKQPDDTARLLVWYRALLGLLAAGGMPARPHETPVAYATRVEQGIPPEAGLLRVAEMVSALGYGREDAVTPADVGAAAKCYQAVWRAVPIKGRLRWLARRMLRGLGSVRQVP